MFGLFCVQYVIGCYSTCKNVTLENGKCSGAGCCQADVPKGIQYYRGYFNENYNTSTWPDNPCSYVTLMEKAAFSFNTSYVRSNSSVFDETSNGVVPIVLDWKIDAHACEEAKNTSSYACGSSNSVCVNATTIEPGYLCNCSDGYRGNPYITDGCQGDFPFAALYI